MFKEFTGISDIKDPFSPKMAIGKDLTLKEVPLPVSEKNQ